MDKPDPLWVTPAALKANVSFLSDPSDDYFLTVTAVVGLNESEPAPNDGIVFSYFMDSPAPQKCSLDLPPVHISEQMNSGLQLQLSFEHPWLFHSRLEDIIGPHETNLDSQEDELFNDWLPKFDYSVTMNKHLRLSDSCTENVCQKALPVDAGHDEHCVKISGELEKIQVEGTGDYCTLAKRWKNNNNVIIISVVAVSAAAVIFCVFFMIFRKKISPSSSTPRSMMFNGQNKNGTLRIDRERVDEVITTPASPMPLLSDVSETCDGIPTTEQVLRLPLGLPTKDEGGCDVTEVQKYPVQEGGYEKGINLEEDETTPALCSAYESRQVVVELAPGEEAEGYREDKSTTP
ncbi:growth/differentiation factor 10b isoform 2-T2 [Aulostomus maculatus]